MRKSAGNPILRFDCGFIWLTAALPHKAISRRYRRKHRKDVAQVKKSPFSAFLVASSLLVSPVAITAQSVASPTAFSVPAANNSYADIADLVLAAPLIVDAQVRKTTKVPAEQAAGVPSHIQRLLVEADVLALIRGDGGVAGQVRFLLDVPKDAKGNIPKLKKQRYLVLGSKVAGKPGDIRLARPDALVEWSAGNDAMLRAITREAVMIDAPQPIVGLTSAFHSPGTVIGEGETQIFVEAQQSQIYSLSVFSRPGLSKRWAVSTGEVIDESAMAPSRNTLLWYRLACGLPRDLDSKLVETAEADNIARAQADYRFVIQSLGACDRTRRLR
jgi:hypothetical protein